MCAPSQSQPALLYLSPACILAVLLTAVVRGELTTVWNYDSSSNAKADAAGNAAKADAPATATKAERPSSSQAPTASEAAASLQSKGTSSSGGTRRRTTKAA